MRLDWLESLISEKFFCDWTILLNFVVNIIGINCPILVIWLLYERMRDNDNELLPVVDACGRVLGRATRGWCHGGSMLLHPVVHLHVFNSRGELYLQHRPEWKDIQPGKWDTAVGGHVDFGEEVDDALRREAREELGILDFEPRMLGRYVFESSRERELVNVFSTVYDADVSPSGELDGGRFWSLEEIRNNLGQSVFTPNFESEFIRFGF